MKLQKGSILKRGSKGTVKITDIINGEDLEGYFIKHNSLSKGHPYRGSINIVLTEIKYGDYKLISPTTSIKKL